MKLTDVRKNLLVGIFAAVGFGCYAGTQQYCTRHMPDVARPEIGRIIPLTANYGRTVYLTGSESHYVNLAYGAGVVFYIMAFAVVLIHAWQAFKQARDG